MIQRKQTILLALALFSFVFLFISPYANFKLGTEVTCYISILAVQNLEGFTKLNYMFIIMQILVTLFMCLVGVAIFMYKKRPLQVRLCAFAVLTNILVVGAMFLTTTMFTNALQLPKDTKDIVNYLFPAYIPLVTLLLVNFAQRAIRKDEAMVRSLDRLR
jgi:hypothetical protein